MGDQTLDIAETQILVHYGGDANGYYWHHRILLHRIEGGRRLCLTPDLDTVTHDLNQRAHRILDRKSNFPADIIGEIYAFDPIGRSQLLAYKRRAKVQASILGEAEVGESEAYEWLVSEPGHQLFGQIIDSTLMDNGATGVCFNSKGVAIIDGGVL